MPIFLTAQGNSPVVHFKSGDKVFGENIDAFIGNPDIAPSEKIDGYYYRYVQFEAIPSLDQQNEIKSSGLKLIEYLPDNTYMVGFPEGYQVSQLNIFDARSIVKIDIEDKIDQRFFDRSWPEWVEDKGSMKLILKSYQFTSSDTFVNLLRQNGVNVEESNVHMPFVFVELTESEVLSIAALPFIQYVDFGPDPGVKEDTGGRTLQRANLVNNTVPGGLKYDGTGVNIMVRDDGGVGPHIDFEGRIVDFTTGGGGTHGDGVAGVFAGAGNLDPTTSGVASGSNIYVLNYQSEFTDNTIALHQSDGVVITNSSYGNGCNAGYTATTQRVDQQMIDNPTLMHVFSCGNSGTSNCGYGAGAGWGNITGGHKQGKNVMAVANLDANGNLIYHSSRGPAHDGRIKPDIAAHGQGQISTDPDNVYQSFGGTSSAAPTMAGSMAQLYQVYKDLNGGTTPEASFIKAVILNSAHDMGNPGPDFKYGWGRIDAYEAFQVLSNNQYLASSISQGERNNHTITVPSGVAEFRAMVYWRDPAGSLSSNIALVNNLDIFVNDPANALFRPWILDPTPHPQLLDAPATTGIDQLNNMEQVTFYNPAVGAYSLKVDGSVIPMGVQEYYVVWSFIYEGVMVTYPNGGEGFVPGETERIHWADTQTSLPYTIEYSLDNFTTWTNIANNVAGNVRVFNWTVPAEITGDAKVRVRKQGSDDRSDNAFSIIDLPANLTVTEVCQTGATLEWNPVNGADSYTVYRLGEKYMEAIETTTTTYFDFSDLTSNETAWLSVQALNSLGVIGRRSDAISHFIDSNTIVCPTCEDGIQNGRETGIDCGGAFVILVHAQIYFHWYILMKQS